MMKLPAPLAAIKLTISNSKNDAITLLRTNFNYQGKIILNNENFISLLNCKVDLKTFMGLATPMNMLFKFLLDRVIFMAKISLPCRCKI